MKYYLAGPMRGLPDSNYGAFAEARERLRRSGYDVHCPAEGATEPATDDSYAPQMAGCLDAVLKSDALIVLPGWGKSEGAKVEVAVAVATGKPVFAYHRHRPHPVEELGGLRIVTRAEMLK
jgi:nucleoside 2-deoxyribosyltransferase